MLQQYFELLDSVINPFLDKNIIIYGCDEGGVFLRNYLKIKYNKVIKCFVDRWAKSTTSTVLHLYSLFYLYDANDVIFNVTNKDIKAEFLDIGEDWDDNIKYSTNQIIDVYSHIFDHGGPQTISYYDFVSYCWNIDFSDTIPRKDVVGEDAHGYYPTNLDVLLDVFSTRDIEKDDALFDFGCGKGAILSVAHQMGFAKCGGVEYTKEIYDKLVNNIAKMTDVSCALTGYETIIDGISLFNADAASLKNVLDDYNWFTLFNPFGLDKTNEVIRNILSSVERKPRKIHILYAEPMGHDVIVSSNCFMKTKEYKTDFFEGTYWSFLYEN